MLAALLLGGFLPGELLAEEESSEPTQTIESHSQPKSDLDVVIDSSIPEGRVVEGWIDERARSALSGRDPLGEDESLRIMLAGGPYDYRIELQLWRGSDLLRAQPEPIVCECGTDEMLDRVAEATGAAADRFSDSRQAEASTRASELDEWQRTHSDRDTGDPSGGRYRPGPLGYAGITGLVLGTGTLTAGIVMAVRKTSQVSDLAHFERDLRTPGLALVGIGSALLVQGVTTLVVDLVRYRRGTRLRSMARRGTWPNASRASATRWRW